MRSAGTTRSENAGKEKEKTGENSVHRKTKVSRAQSSCRGDLRRDRKGVSRWTTG